MKNILFAVAAVSLLAACSSPVLKWIDIPAGGDGRSGDKAIISLSFNIEGETVLPIGTTPDNSGKIPIVAILPADTRVNALSPAVEFIGKSLDPPPSRSADFSDPKPYRVTAWDGSTLDYLVTAVVKTDASKEIVRFALEVSATLTAEGSIDETAGTISIGVPAGTDTRSMTAHIAHTGVLLTNPNNGSHAADTVDYSGDFSTPTRWIVTARDGSTRPYTVTVVRKKSSDKEITAFHLGIAGESVIIGSEPQPDGKYLILDIVPASPTLSLAGKSPGITYNGSAISPEPTTPENFGDLTNPVTYTVTAEDHSVRDYVVKIMLKDTAATSDKQITGFYFTNPLIEGVIDEAAKTIALTVPAGTNLKQSPAVYYRGASVIPMSGQLVDFSKAVDPATPMEYVVRDGNGDPQPYEVTVFTRAVPSSPEITVSGSGDEKVAIGTDANGKYTAVVEMPVYIENPVININYPGAGNTVTIGSIDTTINTDASIRLDNNNLTINNNKVFNYVPIRLDDGSYIYVLVVNPSSGGTAPVPADPDYATASIDAFYFPSPVAVGEIGKTDGTDGAGTPADPYHIRVTVPYGTDRRALTPVICYTGKEIVGIPGANPLKDGARSFTDERDYTVKAHDGATTKTYRVTVTAAPNTARDITAFAFNEISAANTSAIIGSMPNAAGNYPIQITVPKGQGISSLTPVITHTGASIAGAGFATAGGSGTQTAGTPTAFSATTAVPYTVTAEDGSKKTYAVTVRHAGDDDDDLEITGFYFTSPLAAGTINQNAGDISVIVPTNTNTASLTPTVYFKGMSVSPGSGAANNFNGPVVYTVTGINGKTRPYTVTVKKTPSSAKDIIRFDFPGITGAETVIGAVPGSDGSYPISVWVPAGVVLDNRSPDITHTGVSMDPAAGTSLDFNVPQTCTVTAEDGSTKTYRVTVVPLSGDAKLITSLMFNEVPLTGGGTIRVTAAVDQESHTITATVPHTATNLLQPVITYIGRSIAGPDGGDKTANPFTDTARDFSAGQTYTVKDQNGAEQAYTVTVIRQSSVVVDFTGEEDSTIIADNVFDQTTGVITITVNTANVDPPYEWYVDGVKQPVPGSQAAFTLSVGDGTYIPGKHEILVSGKKDGLHYTGKAYFTVSGGTK
jgi:hypothetical protein